MDLPAVAKPQVILNVSHYEGIYCECLKAASRIAQTNGLDAKDKMDIADKLFEQFCSDQVASAQEKTRAKSQIEALQPIISMLERRGM